VWVTEAVVCLTAAPPVQLSVRARRLRNSLGVLLAHATQLPLSNKLLKNIQTAQLYSGRVGVGGGTEHFMAVYFYGRLSAQRVATTVSVCRVGAFQNVIGAIRGPYKTLQAICCFLSSYLQQ